MRCYSPLPFSKVRSIATVRVLSAAPFLCLALVEVAMADTSQPGLCVCQPAYDDERDQNDGRLHHSQRADARQPARIPETEDRRPEHLGSGSGKEERSAYLTHRDHKQQYPIREQAGTQ